jgi:hypothetical protein
MEHYESGLVLRFAIVMSGRSETDWAALSPRTKGRWLDKSRDALCAVLNEKEVVAKLPLLVNNLTQRDQ